MIVERVKTPWVKNLYHAEISQLINTKNQFIAFYLIGSFSVSDAQEGYSFSGLSNVFY